MEKLIEQIRARLAQLAEQRSAQIEVLETIGNTIEGEKRSTNPDEDAAISAAKAAITKIDADAEESRASLAEYEGILERSKAAASVNFNTKSVEQPLDVEGRDLTTLSVADARGRALSAVESRSTRFISDDHREAVAKLIEGRDAVADHVARRTLATASDEYRTAWAKAMTGTLLTGRDAELLGNAQVLERSMTSGTGSSGGYLVPVLIDPTLVITGAGSVNPFRNLATIKRIATSTWKGATAAQVTAGYVGEGSAFADNTPTLTQPSIPTYKAGVFIPATFEAFEDIDGLAADVLALISDARDNFEAAEFATGTGSSAAKGVVTAVTAITASRVSPATGGAFAVADVYSVHNALPARHRVAASAANRAWVANVAVIDAARQFATANNYHAFLTDLGGGAPSQLLGDQLVESSAMSSTLTTGQNVLLYGDFSRFNIIDHVGMSTEFIPNLFDTSTGRPTGTRAWLTHWRFGSDVVDANAFRVLKL